VLLVDWVSRARPAGGVAWLSLGPHDRDRRRFWTAATAALSRATGGLGALALPPRARLDAFLPTLVELLRGLERPLTLVLDDFQELRGSRAVADLEAVLERAPARLRLVVSTRADPPFRLERLRLAGCLAEVRAADLAFTREETSELAGELGLGLDPAGVGTLWRRTEGWVAGLRLVALSLRNEPEPHALIEELAGDDRALSDYLTTEVIARQPAPVREFMLRTSIAGHLSGELADALTGTAGGDRTLAELARGEGLVSRLHGRGAWYRYHPLFADVLRLELRRESPELLPELHRRAGRWHARHGEPLEAVRHAVAAGEWALAGEVAGAHWLTLMTRGHGALLRELIRPIPEEEVRSNPELALACGGLLLEAGDDEAADELLAAAREPDANMPERRRRRVLVMAAAADLLRARFRGDVGEALESARRSLAGRWHRDVTADVRALMVAHLGIASFWSGRIEDGTGLLGEAVGLARGCGNDYVAFLAQGYAAIADVQTGRIGRAAERARSALDLAHAGGWDSAPQAGAAYVALATVHVQRGELRVAEGLLTSARGALERSGERLVHLAAAQLEARLLLSGGDALGALDVLRGASAAADPVPGFLRVWGGMLEAELLLALGDADEARRTLRALDAGEDASDAATGLARVELAAGDAEAAVTALAAFRADERPAVRPTAAVDAALLEAIAHDGLRDEPAALTALERALDLAEPRGFRSPFTRHRAAARSLLRRRIAAGTAHRAFAGELLAALDDGAAAGRPAAGPLLEPLSERELAVLRFLPTMMSNAEIAADMFVSVNTVKTHLRHLYRKLDVADRRAAVRRGRDLRLLSPGLADR
jgi:LuxR family maltose regulon positive regulatory protein